MSKEDIIDMVTRDWEKVYKRMDAACESIPKYVASIKKVDDFVYSQPQDITLEIEPAINTMRCTLKDTAYSQGFADAVKLMCACFSSGESLNLIEFISSGLQKV
jgi:hypothetical protein